MNKKTVLAAFLSAVLLSGWVQAETAPTTAAPATAATTAPQDLGEKLKPLFGSAPDAIKATPVPGVFEAAFGMETIYVTADGRYFFSGDLIDGETRSNLTEQGRTTARKTEMAKLDATKTVEFKAKGTEKHVLAVFTDVDCGYCVKLHKEVPQLNEAGVTVRYYAYPRAGIGSDSYKKIVNVWCADNPQEAMTKSKNGEAVPEKTCTNPVAEEFELGQKIGVNGTPALVTEDGTMIPGYRPADQLVKMLDEMKTKVN